MAGYTRAFDKTAGDRIDAEDFVDEYISLGDAFDNSSGHIHDGTVGNGSLVPLISDPNQYTSVFANGNLNEIEVAVENVGAKEVQFYIRDGVLVPRLDDDVSLGTSSNRMADVYATGLHTNTIDLTVGPEISAVLEEDDMVSDSAVALATQQSIKAYVDNTVASSAGIFTQAKIVRRNSDQALSGAMAVYLQTTIDVEEGSYVHLFGNLTGQGETNSGSVLARLYQNGAAIGGEDVYVTSSAIAGITHHGTVSIIERVGPLTAGTYTFGIYAREQGCEGTGLYATLTLLEEKG